MASRAEITERLVETVRDGQIDPKDRQRAAGALVSVLQVRIKDGTQKVSQCHDPDLAIPALARLRDLQSLLADVTRLELELGVEVAVPGLLARFGGRIVEVRPKEEFERFWAGTAHQSTQSRYYERLRGTAKG